MQKDEIIRFGKFVLVGVGNTLIDFSILNILIATIGLASGYEYFLFKCISFAAAVVFSYLANGRWVFESKSKKFGVFLAVSLIGLGVNSLVAVVVFTLGSKGTLVALSDALWANIGAVCGSIVVLFTNYFGYKYLVFNKPQTL